MFTRNLVTAAGGAEMEGRNPDSSGSPHFYGVPGNFLKFNKLFRVLSLTGKGGEGSMYFSGY